MMKFLALVLGFSLPASAVAETPLTAEPFGLTPPEGTYIEEVPGVAVSPNGAQVYVFNRGQRALLVFGKNGGFLREIGAGLFDVPHGLRVDEAGNIWTTDTGTHLVLKFSPQGKLMMVLGKKGTASEGWFKRDYNHYFLNKPSDVAFDSAGNIYVADGGNFRVVKFSPQGVVINTFGEKGTEPGQFNFPHSLVIDETGRLLVADRENKRIQLFDESGGFLAAWTNIGYPYMLALAPGGGVWMTDARADMLVRLGTSGQLLQSFGSTGKGTGQYGFLHGVAIFDDALLVSDILNWKVERLSLTGKATVSENVARTGKTSAAKSLAH